MIKGGYDDSLKQLVGKENFYCLAHFKICFHSRLKMPETHRFKTIEIFILKN